MTNEFEKAIRELYYNSRHMETAEGIENFLQDAATAIESLCDKRMGEFDVWKFENGWVLEKHWSGAHIYYHPKENIYKQTAQLIELFKKEKGI